MTSGQGRWRSNTHESSVLIRKEFHITLDFVMGFPTSKGNIVILTVVDHFSKAAHLFVLPKLPTVLETAYLLVDHIFRLHDIASDIVSDRGPQFTSKVWKTSAKALGASSACLPVITSPTARLKGLFRTWSLPFAALPLPTHLHGVIIFPQWNTPITYSPVLQIGCPPLRHHWATSLSFSPPTTLAIAVPSMQWGLENCKVMACTQNSSWHSAYCHRQWAPSYQPSQLVWLSIHNIPLVTKRPVKSLPTSLVPSPLKILSIPLPSIWPWLRPWRSTLPSTFPRYNLCPPALYPLLLNNHFSHGSSVLILLIWCGVWWRSITRHGDKGMALRAGSGLHALLWNPEMWWCRGCGEVVWANYLCCTAVEGIGALLRRQCVRTLLFCLTFLLDHGQCHGQKMSSFPWCKYMSSISSSENGRAQSYSHQSHIQSSELLRPHLHLPPSLHLSQSLK